MCKAPLVSAASPGDRLQVIPTDEPTVTVAIDVTPLDPTTAAFDPGSFVEGSAATPILAKDHR